jgi:hypothetical protein
MLDIQAGYLRDHYSWNWHTLILSGDDTGAIKAEFEQSSAVESLWERALLHKSVRDYSPARSEGGEIVHFILGMMDGRNTIEQIASRVREKFPSRFKSQWEAQSYVNDLSQDFCA